MPLPSAISAQRAITNGEPASGGLPGSSTHFASWPQFPPMWAVGRHLPSPLVLRGPSRDVDGQVTAVRHGEPVTETAPGRMAWESGGPRAGGVGPGCPGVRGLRGSHCGGVALSPGSREQVHGERMRARGSRCPRRSGRVRVREPVPREGSQSHTLSRADGGCASALRVREEGRRQLDVGEHLWVT